MLDRRTFLRDASLTTLSTIPLLRPMSNADETKRAATRFYETLNEALRTGNMHLLDRVLAPNVIDHDPVPGQKPGREEIKRTFGEGRAAFPDTTITIDDILVEGDKAAVRVTNRMTHRGEFMGVPATGKQLTQVGIDILRIENGVVAERWGQFDMLGFLQQLGLEPARRA
jgi:steroid delta-isomerase-like uncharacterized protein